MAGGWPTHHVAPKCEELGSPLVHLVRDKSRKGGFKNEKPRSPRGFFMPLSLLFLRLIQWSATSGRLQLNDAVVKDDAIQDYVEHCWQHLSKGFFYLNAHKNSSEHHACQ